MNLSCFCIPNCFRWRRSNPSNNNAQSPSLSSSIWPPTLAFERTALTKQDVPYVLAPSSTNTNGIKKGNDVKVLMISPKFSRQILTQHEDNTHNHNHDKHNESNERSNFVISKDKEAPCHTDCCLLQKPSKPSPLLRHALTNANGSVWSRQRPLVGRALATQKSRQIAAREAVSRAMYLLDKKINHGSTNNSNNDDMAIAVVDVRDFALQVAVHTMVITVLGINEEEKDTESHCTKDKESNCNCNENMDLLNLAELSLKGLFHPSLLPVHRGDNATLHTKNLNEAVSRIASKLASSSSMVEEDNDSKSNHNDKENCLLMNLLKMEDSSLSPQSLSRLEVIANAHSALLAGTQTISTTIAGALMHMAEHRNDCCLNESSTWKHGRVITRETIRLLPPVASLPRVPTVSDLHLTNSLLKPKKENKGEAPHQQEEEVQDRTIKCGDLLLVDLLAFAHPNNNYWKWRSPALSQGKKWNEGESTAAPWGVGQRQCLAGALSIECISSVLEGLVNAGYQWELPKGAEPGSNDEGGWMKNVHYKPTLCYPNPLLIEFSRKTP